MIDTQTKGSPGWYLWRLHRKLQDRKQTIEDLFARYENRAAVPDVMKAAPGSAEKFYQASRTGLAEMIVKAVKYPLRVQGVRTMAAASRGDLGDEVAEQLFRSSGMSGEIDDVHRVSLIAGSGYAITSIYDGEPSYTAEDPRQVVTLHDPVKQSKIVAAAKFYHDDEASRSVAVLYLPGRVFHAVAPQESEQQTQFSTGWAWDKEQGGELGIPLPLPGFMPVLRYRNEEGVGDFARHVGLLDRIDHMILQGMTIATIQAYKQRAIKAPLEDLPDEDPETGQKIDYDNVFSSDPGALWKLPETAELWESGNVDLTPVWTGMEKFVQQLSAVTFTPLSMFSPDGMNQSAAGAAFAREGRTYKIEDRHDRFGEMHARALAQLFQLAGDKDRSDWSQIEVVWRPAEKYSLAERGDAMSKYAAGGVPWRTRMIEVGQFTPQQVNRMEAERISDELMLPVAPKPGA